MTFIIEPSLEKVVLPVDNEAIPICTHTHTDTFNSLSPGQLSPTAVLFFRTLLLQSLSYSLQISSFYFSRFSQTVHYYKANVFTDMILEILFIQPGFS